MNKSDFIYQYWERSEVKEVCRKIISSGCLSEDELLFWIPNNVKRMHGLPATRCIAKRKTKYKLDRIGDLLHRMYLPLQELAHEKTIQAITNSFDQFADIRDINVGTKVTCFYGIDGE